MTAAPKVLEKRNGYGSVPIIDPNTGTARTGFISLDFTKQIAKDGLGRASEFAELIVHLLMRPHAVFQGLRLDHPEIDEDDWFCYVATPTHAYDYRRNARRTAWLGQVVIIPVTSDWVVYNWYWVKSDPSDDRLPIDHQNRYEKRLI